MALSQAEIKQLIEENFSPVGAPKNLLTDTFETKVAALSGDVTRHNAAADIAFVEAKGFIADENDGKAAAEAALTEASDDAGSRRIETLQDLRDLAGILDAAENDKERRDALAGISTRMISNYFAFLDKQRATAQAENRKANREAHYMALLYAQLAELNAEISRLDDLIDDLRDQIAQIDVEIDALQQALDIGDFSGPAAQKAIDDYNRAHPDNPIDPNDPDDARRAAQWALRNKQGQKDDLQSRMDDAIAKRDDMIQDRDGLIAEVDELEAAAAKGQGALDAKANLKVRENTTERIEAIRGQSVDRAINESLDRAQGWNDETSHLAAVARDQREARLGLEVDIGALSPSATLSETLDLNSLTLNALPTLDSSARTTSVADNLDSADVEGLEIKSSFSKASGLDNLDVAQIESDLDLNQALAAKVDDPPGTKLG